MDRKEFEAEELLLTGKGKLTLVVSGDKSYLFAKTENTTLKNLFEMIDETDSLFGIDEFSKTTENKEILDYLSEKFDQILFTGCSNTIIDEAQWLEEKNRHEANEEFMDEIKATFGSEEEFQKTVRSNLKKKFENVPIVNSGRKIGRNEKCPCGSGKKFKACHQRENLLNQQVLFQDLRKSTPNPRKGFKRENQ